MHLCHIHEFLDSVQDDRTFLESVQYGNLLQVFTNVIRMKQFSGYIIIKDIKFSSPVEYFHIQIKIEPKSVKTRIYVY